MQDQMVLKRVALIKARKEKGLKEKDIAQVCNVTPRYIQMIEQGVRNPSLPIALKLEESREIVMAKMSVKKKIEKLVFLENNEPSTTSLRIAEELETEHKYVIRLIRKYHSELSEFGLLSFQNSINRGTSGQQTEFAILNEGQTLFLFTLMKNSKEVIKVKQNLVKGFLYLRKTLARIASQQANEAWLEMRKSGKVERRLETDTIQDFIYYATAQGSKNANRYYKNITTMQNKALFIIEQEFPNLRDVLSGRQLNILKSVDMAVMYALKDGMEQGLDYHDIYKLAKNHVETMMLVFPRTVVPEQINIPCLASPGSTWPK